jgi:preprotein translocase subunit SecE
MAAAGVPARSSGTVMKANAVEFVQQVRQELSRVTWPTRKETLITTALVFAMVFIAAAFFFVTDQVLSYGVRLVFGLGS